VWIPSSAQQIESAAAEGDLAETSSFDAKRELGPPKKNAEIAKDIAAMSTDGGVLLYGIAEDDNGQPTIPAPIELVGVADRIGQIVETSISEPPQVVIHERRLERDPALGYLVVEVPMSPRAPHQVVVGGDLRYYGRGPTGNRRLTEGDIARLYARRDRWEQDRESLLADCIASAPVPLSEDKGFLHGVVRPVAGPRDLTEKAIAALGGSSAAHRELVQATGVLGRRQKNGYSPALSEAGIWERRAADLWLLTNSTPDEVGDPNEVTGLTQAEIDLDGSIRLFCGRATDVHLGVRDPNERQIIEVLVAGNVAEFLGAAHRLLEAGDFNGAVDIGIAITGLGGAKSNTRDVANTWTSRRFSYGRGEYRTTRRVPRHELANPESLSLALLRPFLDAATGVENFNPFA
jgi:hypothetical protein